MKTFSDAGGRIWTISLTLGTAQAVKKQIGVDLLQPEAGDPPLLTRLGTDELLLGEVIAALLMGQFEANRSNESDLMASFDGATLAAAQEAFYQELIDFFQNRGRPDRARAVAKQRDLIKAAVLALDREIAAIEIEATLSGAMSGASQEASESTQPD